MNMTHQRILVIGATGNQGGAVVKALQRTGVAVRAFVRPHAPTTSRSEKAQQLAQQGVQIARGDLDDLASLVRAMSDVSGVFCVTTFQERGRKQRKSKGNASPMPRNEPAFSTWSMPRSGGRIATVASPISKANGMSSSTFVLWESPQRFSARPPS